MVYGSNTTSACILLCAALLNWTWRLPRSSPIGSVSEILEGEPPHLPRGAIAQAWSVAVVLRVWQEIEALTASWTAPQAFCLNRQCVPHLAIDFLAETHYSFKEGRERYG